MIKKPRYQAPEGVEVMLCPRCEEWALPAPAPAGYGLIDEPCLNCGELPLEVNVDNLFDRLVKAEGENKLLKAELDAYKTVKEEVVRAAMKEAEKPDVLYSQDGKVVARLIYYIDGTREWRFYDEEEDVDEGGDRG